MLTIYLQQEKNEQNSDYVAATQGLTRIHAMIDSLRTNDADQIVTQKLSYLELDYVQSFLRTFAKQHGKTILFHGPFELYVCIDQPKFERLIQNLCVNALEAAQSVVRVDWEVKKNNLIVKVIDDGHGVPHSFRSQLFHSVASHGKTGGTGLGLAFCKRVAEGHGGSLSYRREEGFTVFEIIMPVLVVEAEDHDVQKPTAGQLDCEKMFRVSIHMPAAAESASALALSLRSYLPYIAADCDPQTIADANVIVVMDLLDVDDLPAGKDLIFYKSKAGGVEDLIAKVKYRYLSWKDSI